MQRARRRWYLTVGIGTFCATSLSLQADPITWTGNGATQAWSDPDNWSDVAEPSGDDITFNNTGAAATAGTTTSIVTSSLNVSSVTFTNDTATSTHTITINSGQTLTVDGASGANTFVVGNLTPDSVVTDVTVKGATPGVGSLVLSNTSTDLLITQNTANVAATAGRSILNLADLGSFSATLNEVRLASVGNTIGELTLSKLSNTITADSLLLATGTTRGTSGTFVRLGASNTLNANLIILAGGRMSATMQFQAGLAGTPSVTIRGKAGGTSRADLVIGNQGGYLSSGTGGSSSSAGVVNWNGATVDALLDELVLGTAGGVASSTAGRGDGTLNFDAGTINATSVTLGRLPNITAAGAAGSGTLGTLTVDGTGQLQTTTITLGLSLDADTGANPAVTGTLRVLGGAVTTTGNVVMGSHTAGTPSPAAATAVVEVNGGNLTVGGNITEGAGNNVGTVTVNGGALAVTGGSITTDTVNLTTGSITGVSSITAALSTGPAFQLSPGGAGTAGTLAVTGPATLGGTLRADIGGAAADVLNVSGVLDITAATLNFNQLGPLTASSYVLASYGSLTGGQFASVQNLPAGYSLDYNYQGANQIALVPEPTAVSLLALGGLLLRRRRRIV